MLSTYGEPLRLSDPSKFSKTKLLVERKGTGWPMALFCGRCLARGSNSKVFRGMCISTEKAWNDVAAEARREAQQRTNECGDLAVRIPRHESDTAHASHAKWEFCLAALAAYHGIGVDIYDAFYAPKTTRMQHKGLHMVMKHYPMDLSTAILDFEDDFEMNKAAIGQQLCDKIRTLASLDILMYDLKAQNVVLSFEPLDVRFIDFGKEFTERRGTEHCPTIDFVDGWLRERGRSDARTRQSVLEATMLVILSSTITHEMHSQKRSLKVYDKAMREQLNPIIGLVQRRRETMTPLVVQCVKEVLRQEPVIDTVTHYSGSRDANTRRMFSRAGFVRAATDQSE